jgi:hypothetical protein
MAKAGRPAKVSKYRLLNAISRSFNVTEVARYLRVDRTTVYNTALRHGISLSTELRDFSTPDSAPEAPVSQPCEPVTTQEDPPKQEPNALRLSVSDFTGRNCGDVGSSRPDANSYEARYRRLKW